MERAIKLAIEKGGYKSYFSNGGRYGEIAEPYWEERLVLDPLFWQALGKALGWDKRNPFGGELYEWKHNALRYFKLRMTGGDEEKFWKELLEKENL